MKKKRNRTIILFVSVLLTALILFSITTVCLGTFGSNAKSDISGRLYRGSFTYAGTEDTFYYSDAYFNNEVFTEKEHLRTMSAAMAFSASGNSAEDVIGLMTDIGMDTGSITVADFVKGTPDTIGTVIAHKSLGDTTLVAVAIRGNDYAGEWASNMLAGTDGDAAGFSAAAAKVSDRLQAYLEENGIGKAKIWMCGYSRAGGIANLVGREMNEDPDAYHTCADDIYVYTFEAPRSSADDTVYENIRHITDVNDLVPRFFPEAWGLHLNGVTEKIGDPSDTLMTKKFQLNSDGYIADHEERAKSLFLEQLETFVSSAVTREQYAVSYQQVFSALCELYFAKTDEERQALGDYFKAVGEQIKDSAELKVIIGKVYWGIAGNSDVTSLSSLITDAMDTVSAETAPPLTDAEYASMKEAVTPLSELVIGLGNIDSSYKEPNEKGSMKYVSFYHILTFADNLTELIRPHYNKEIFDKLKKLDGYYTAGVRIKPGDVSVGDQRYTYADYGGPLEDIARMNGFSDDDLKVWRNGYDLRIDTDLTEIPDPDLELVLKASGILDKCMQMLSFYQAQMTKTVGYRSCEPDKSVKLKDNPSVITVPDEIADNTTRLAVVRVDENGSERIDSSIEINDAGETELHFNCTIPAVYAAAYDAYTHIRLAEVDRDGEITSVDVSHIQRYLAKLEKFGGYQNKTADIDGDGEVTSVDASWLQRWLAKLEVPYRVAEPI